MEEKLMEERKNMLLDLMKDPTYVPMKLKELALLLGVTKEQRGELEEVLNELVASGKVGISKKGKYARSEVFAQTGVFAAHHRGFGFVTIEGREDDLFIPGMPWTGIRSRSSSMRTEEAAGRRRES